jgi:serine/threonine-protein kinase CTR1
LSGGGEYYAQTLSTAAASEVDAFGYLHDDGFKVGEVRNKLSEGPPWTGGSSGKSWAQQTEESYQLQLALVLRLSSDATCADDPNFLDPVPDEAASRISSSPEAISHRFWVCLLIVVP